MYRKIIAVFMAAMVVATTCVVPSFATDYQSTYNFWNWLYDNGGFVSKSIASTADSVCSLSDDGLHHSTQHQKRAFTGDGREEDEAPIYDCICDVCGQTFEAVATDLENAYNSASPSYTVSSNGRVYVPMSFNSRASADVYTASTPVVIEYSDSYDVTYSFSYIGETLNQASRLEAYFDTCGQERLYFEKEPIAYRDDEFFLQTYFYCPYGTSGMNFVERDSALGLCYVDVEPGVERYRIWEDWIWAKRNGEIWRYEYSKVFYCVESVDVSDTPISGGGSISYTDDNSNNKIYDAEFMDFSTNEYHNPVTDYSTKVDNWNYDYSTRTFTGCTEDGDVKIVYGDEYMSVTENGNIYNYYYSSGSGSGSGGDSSGDDDGEGLFGEIGELLGTLLGGLIDLVTGVLSGILDSLISLVEMTIEKLGSVVNLFGSFGDALRALWSWLPEDIITILSAGVSVVIFAAVLKLFI